MMMMMMDDDCVASATVLCAPIYFNTLQKVALAAIVFVAGLRRKDSPESRWDSHSHNNSGIMAVMADEERGRIRTRRPT
jgi:hypothetical protein